MYDYVVTASYKHTTSMKTWSFEVLTQMFKTATLQGYRRKLLSSETELGERTCMEKPKKYTTILSKIFSL
jgi:hypothetical protein